MVTHHSTASHGPAKRKSPAGRSAPAAPKRERRKDARPGELLAAALELFVEKGYAATRVEEVAQHAGVSKGTLFLYFPSKEELFKAVVRRFLVDQQPEWKVKIESWPGNTPDLLRYTMQEWWQQVGMTAISGISKLIMSEAANFPELAAFYEQEVLAPGRKLVRHILQRGEERGEFRIHNQEYAVYAVLAPLLFLMTWRHSIGAGAPSASTLPPIDPNKYLEEQIRILLHGLCGDDAVSPVSPKKAISAKKVKKT